MRPKLLKTTLGTYEPAVWTGKNESGWKVLGDRVMVLPDTAAETTEGGIELPQEITGRIQMAAEAGVVISVGDGAFKWNSDKMTPYEGEKPKPGDRVAIERFSGQLRHGDDGKVYRIMESACVGAIYKKENE